MTDHYAIDPARSEVRVRTRAKGMLAALAHDLEIRAEGIHGHATADGPAWAVELTVPVGKMRVAGTLHGDRLDAAALSGGDRAEIERKLREDVLATPDVIARATGETRDRGEVVIALRGTARAPVRQRVEAKPGGAPGGGEPEAELVVTGSCELSLKALGVREVKGPLGAFKIADAVELFYTITVKRA